MTMPIRQRSASSRARVVVVGAGGNIGSHLVSHLGRMEHVREVVLIDRGKYELSNLVSQDVTSREVGRRKAVVQANRLRRINPALVVRWHAEPAEDVPLGCLRGDVLLACLDSRAARQFVNQAARRLGMPWIDAGVYADGLLAQVSAYASEPGQPCLECAWDDRDYAALQQTYSCGGIATEPPATGAPSSLGALAAALQALECRKLLAGALDRVAFGRQVLIDASGHKQYVTAFRRNAACRMPEHRPWSIRRFRHRLEDATVEQLLALRRGVHEADRLTLRVAGRAFVTQLTCPTCGYGRPLLRLAGAHGPARGRCAACGVSMVVAGFDVRDRVSVAELSTALRSRSLRSLGLRHGDVFTIAGAAGDLHYAIDGGVPPIGSDTRRATE